jgi:hypothetical protein
MHKVNVHPQEVGQKTVSEAVESQATVSDNVLQKHTSLRRIEGPLAAECPIVFWCNPRVRSDA